MKVKLNARDRIVIKEEILPVNKASKMDMILTLEIIDIIELKSDEFKEYGIHTSQDGRIIIDTTKDNVLKEFDLNKYQIDFIKSQVAKKEKDGWSRANALTFQKIEKW